MKTLFSLFSLCLIVNVVTGQSFRNGIFLHHSTGMNIWGPNPDGNSNTSIPREMHLYNTAHSYQGTDSIWLTEEWWEPGDNEWSTQDQFFKEDTLQTNIANYLLSYPIIIIKSCFPSSDIDVVGNPSDTLNPTYKSVSNYKWHWRHIIKVMESHPEHFFSIWTNAPLEISSTNSVSAGLSKSFCKWAKDTLARGLDQEYGQFPPNVYVFDFFSKLTDVNGYLQNQYRTVEYNSHPNGPATDTVAPIFVSEIFNAAIAYESHSDETHSSIRQIADLRIYPNPSNGLINITTGNLSDNSVLTIINLSGQILYSAILKP